MKKIVWSVLLHLVALAIILAIVPTTDLQPPDITFEMEGRIVSTHVDETGAITALTLRIRGRDESVDIASSRVITLNSKFPKHSLLPDMMVYIHLREEAPPVAEVVLIDMHDYRQTLR